MLGVFINGFSKYQNVGNIDLTIIRSDGYISINYAKGKMTVNVAIEVNYLTRECCGKKCKQTFANFKVSTDRNDVMMVINFCGYRYRKILTCLGLVFSMVYNALHCWIN